MRGIHNIGEPIACVCGMTFKSKSSRYRHTSVCVHSPQRSRKMEEKSEPNVISLYKFEETPNLAINGWI